jgi:uncharacterized protein
VEVISSELAVVEVGRAVARNGGRGHRERAALDFLFGAVVLLPLDVTFLEAAIHIVPPTLRTLDAIHVASALGVGDALRAIVTYDLRMQEAARLAGLTVVAPE